MMYQKHRMEYVIYIRKYHESWSFQILVLWESCLPEEQAAAGSSQPVCFPQSASEIQSCVQKSKSCLHTRSSFKSSLSWSWNGEIVAPIRRQILFILATFLGLNHLRFPSIWMIYAWNDFATLTLLNLLGTLHGWARFLTFRWARRRRMVSSKSLALAMH